MKNVVPFFQHDLGEDELDSIARVLGGPILTTGDTVKEFETQFSEYLGRRHALGMTSCTGALHLSLAALGIGPGDEVITTPMTFIATAAAIVEAGATPVFVDVERDTANIDANRIKKAITKKTKAILPVHLYGLMCDMRHIREIADHHKLFIVEDCAHCIEGSRDGVRPGQLSETACFSFYATKNMTCGEGGALVTDKDSLYADLRIKHLHGMTKTAADRQREGYTHWDMETFGWKYNMSNIQAAMLLPQMKRIYANHEKRQALAKRYEQRFAELEEVRLQAIPNSAVHARHLFPIWVPSDRRDELIAFLQTNGIGVVVNYRPVHLTKYFSEKYGFRIGDFPIAESIGESTISLPFFPKMTFEQLDVVADLVNRFFEK